MIVSRARAIKAKCAECMNFYVDGRHDCEITVFPLYKWMPYKQQEPYEWAGNKQKDWETTYRKGRGATQED